MHEVLTLIALLEKARDCHGMTLPGERASDHWPESAIAAALSAVRSLRDNGAWYTGSEVEP